MNQFFYDINKFALYLLKIINKKINERLPVRRVSAVFLGDLIGDEIRAKGFYEIDELQCFMAWLKEKNLNNSNDIMIDLGANIGNHSVFFSNYYARVLSFEPSLRTFCVLRANTLHFSNIECFNVGASLANQEEQDLFVPGANRGGGSLSQPWAEKVKGTDIECEKITLVEIDSVVPKVDSVALIKVDVEGHELEALTGCKRIMKECQPAIIFEHDFSPSSSQLNEGKSLIKFLQDNGYTNFYEVKKDYSKPLDFYEKLPKPIRIILFIFFLPFRYSRKYGVHAVSGFEDRMYGFVIASAK